MTHAFQTTEGIILRAVPFKDHDQILSIFTLDAGIIKIFYRGSRGKSKGAQGFCIPLNKVEIVYRERSGEIFSCHEMTCIDSFSNLRKELSFLETACDLLRVILSSQMVGKASPHLYALLCFYLKKIPSALNASVIACSFRLKLLIHDSLIDIPLACSFCGESLQNEAFIREEGVWCQKHRPIGAQVWDEEELDLFYRIAISQSYRELCLNQISIDLQKKIFDFFEGCIRNR